MPNITSRGFGLLGLIITVAIIAMMVLGWKQLGHDKKTQIEAGNDAIEKAEEAARLQREDEIYLQNQINSSADVDYRSVQHKLEELK